MDDHDTIETFFWCSQCRLPHGTVTRVCPVTGKAVGRVAARPEAPSPLAEAPELMATVRSPAPHAPQAPHGGGNGGGAEVPEASASELRVGQILDHKYAVGEVIGQGAMGTVYEGQHVLLGRAVAIKAIGPAQRRHLDVHARFLDEGRVLASMAHPHVVHVYDLGILFANQALADLADVSVEALLGLSREAFLALFAHVFADPADYLRRVRVLAEGPFAGREDLATTRQVLRWSAKPVEMKDGLGHLETYTELPAA